MTLTAPRTGLRPLEEAVAYQNPHVVERFLESYGLSQGEADELFTETKKWLWLCARAESDPQAPELFIDEGLALLDEMWHAFVLFTREYTSYCDAYLGGYVHHLPTTAAEKAAFRERLERDPAGLRAENEAKLRALYSYVYDHLGEETLVRWYSIYPDKYNREFILSASAGARPTDFLPTEKQNNEATHGP